MNKKFVYQVGNNKKANGYVAVSRVISFHLVMQCVCTVCTWTCGWLFV